jgi:hypothetical protein
MSQGGQIQARGLQGVDLAPGLRALRQTLDAGLAQISLGLPWWFSRYADEQSPDDRGRYASEKEEPGL